MPEISVFTVLVLTAFNLLTVSLALPLLMGRQVSRAGRLAQWSLLSQMAGWVCIIASGFWIGHWLDWALSTASMVFASLTPWLLFGALEQWLGPRPGKRLLLALVVLMPLGYTLLFPQYSPRVGWANFLLAAQLLVVARAALWPERPARKHWRWLLAGCHCVGAGFTFARGVMGAFFPELYPSFQTAHPVNVGAQVSANEILVLITVSVLVAWRDEAEAQLRTLARTDGLTGVANRRCFEEVAAQEVARAQRYKQPLSMILFDIDLFKQINDHHGHAAGDAVIRAAASVVREAVREVDFVARVGGEEFAILLPGIHQAQAVTTAERLRELIAERVTTHEDLHLGFTASLGVSECRLEDTGFGALLHRADQAMYLAKQRGRNRVAVAPEAAAA